MPRPKKCRNVCTLPKCTSFGPDNINSKESKVVIMTVEEFESIRLIDLEGMTQEECAEKMNVARTTVQKIYNDARLKLAKSLVNGDVLKIEGGDYKLCEETQLSNGCKKCPKHKCCRKENESDIEG